MKRTNVSSLLGLRWPRRLFRATKYASTTALTYEASLWQLQRFLRSTEPLAFSLEAYERWLVRQGYPQLTAKVYRSAARSYLGKMVNLLTHSYGDAFWARWQKKAYSLSTLQVYRSALERFKIWLETEPGPSFALADFKRWLEDQGYSPVSVGVYVSAVWTVIWLIL